MPSRLIREGVLDSERIFRAGEAAEVLFMRLMLVADDHGRFDGRVSVICRRCWPIGGPTEKDVLDRLVALTENGLVTTYEVDGKPFIYIPNFNQRLRTKTSKYPEPPNDPPPIVRQMPDKQPADGGRPSGECRPEVEGKGSRREVEVEGKEKEAPRAREPEPDPGMPSAGAVGAAALENLKAKPLSLQEARIDSEAQTPAGLLAAVCVANGIKATAFNPTVIEWAMRGITVARLKDAIGTAKQRKGDQPIGVAYLNPIVTDPGPKTDGRWAFDEDACREKAKELGLWPIRSGLDNSWDALRQRIREKLHDQARGSVH